MPFRLSDNEIHKHLKSSTKAKSSVKGVIHADVFIAGSGPIGATYARTILEQHPTATVLMAEIGSQDDKLVGRHHKNSIKYQKDIDAFVNVIKGALQPVSIPPIDTYQSTLGGDGWTPSPGQKLTMYGNNPNQIPELNLKAMAVTRTVGGMATHWTCACPTPHKEERANNPIPEAELGGLLARAHKLLNVHEAEYDNSIRHTVVKEALLKALPQENVKNLPLAVERRRENPIYVTWTGVDTILGDYAKDERFTLSAETRVTRLVADPQDRSVILGALVRNLQTDEDIVVIAKTFVVACGAICTPQILFNSDIRPWALGRYLAEQSIAFCQIALRRELVEAIEKDPRFADRVKAHHDKHPDDPLPIPFDDPEPQVGILYTAEQPWHVQVHRDAFSYGDVGPRADPRVVVDLRFFGKQDLDENNRVCFGPQEGEMRAWKAGITDIYGMPQATFQVRRSQKDSLRDQRMMGHMTEVANVLGAYLPGSQPQFMDPGLALHVTGTTRIGTDAKTSVADPSSLVHGHKNLWVGGNNCIPDSTACNPTLTSAAIALKGAEAIVKYLQAKK